MYLLRGGLGDIVGSPGWSVENLYITGLLEEGLCPVGRKNKAQLLAGDHLARGSMKTAAKCVSLCESQGYQIHRQVERTLRRWYARAAATPARGSGNHVYRDRDGSSSVVPLLEG